MFVIKSLYAAFFEITGSASRPTGPRAVKPAKTSLPPQAAVRPTAWGAAQKAIGLSLSAVQHLASLTRPKGHRPFAKCCTAFSEFNPPKRP